MLQVSSARRLEDIGASLCAATQRHGAAVLAITHLGQLIHPQYHDATHDAIVYTVCQPELYGALLASDVRFAVFLPCRIAAIKQPSGEGMDGVILETLSPKKFCELIHRPDLERLTAPLETLLKDLMGEAAHPERFVIEAGHVSGASHPGGTEMQVNYQGALPQRIDCHGTKLEDLAGTGRMDSLGG
ncbi:MAG: hypothetical protein JJE04_25265 [Acidobacteriia bacterium]|nr:hypothetical protein [Terriglobia bacterium]